MDFINLSIDRMPRKGSCKNAPKHVDVTLEFSWQRYSLFIQALMVLINKLRLRFSTTGIKNYSTTIDLCPCVTIISSGTCRKWFVLYRLVLLAIKCCLSVQLKHGLGSVKIARLCYGTTLVSFVGMFAQTSVQYYCHRFFLIAYQIGVSRLRHTHTRHD